MFFVMFDCNRLVFQCSLLEILMIERKNERLKNKYESLRKKNHIAHPKYYYYIHTYTTYYNLVL